MKPKHVPQILKNSRFVAYNSAIKWIKKLKIKISEKKEKCLYYRHNLKQKKRPFGRAQNITMPKY